ncbi:MAG: GDP-mannose 4,6-dehydratase [Elusimicrobia bacterium]|nr:GDP-mannose 4,6-dehydratase [Elusimicrobiota bacterium]
MSAKQRVLITGGAGFIGMHAARRFLGKGWNVAIVDNLVRPGTFVNLENIKKEGPLDFIKGDIRESDIWRRALAACAPKPNLILHLAGQVAVTTSIKDPKLDFEVNLASTINFLEHLRRLPAKSRPDLFVLSSTNKVYGNLSDISLRTTSTRYIFTNGTMAIGEDRPLDFHSPYGCSKGAADQYARDYFYSHGIPTTVLRQSCIYGTNQFGLEDQGWVAHFGIRAILKEPVTIYGDGKQVRDLLYIDDLISLFERVYQKRKIASGQIYNVGGGLSSTMSLLELLDHLSKRLNRPIHQRFEGWREGDQKIFIADISKSRRELGWKPAIPLNDGLERMLGWIEQNLPLIKSQLGLDEPKVQRLPRDATRRPTPAPRRDAASNINKRKIFFPASPDVGLLKNARNYSVRHSRAGGNLGPSKSGPRPSRG